MTTRQRHVSCGKYNRLCVLEIGYTYSCSFSFPFLRYRWYLPTIPHGLYGAEYLGYDHALRARRGVLANEADQPQQLMDRHRETRLALCALPSRFVIHVIRAEFHCAVWAKDGSSSHHQVRMWRYIVRVQVLLPWIFVIFLAAVFEKNIRPTICTV